MRILPFLEGGVVTNPYLSEDIQYTCIIGAGFSGLAAARALAERGLPYTMIDQAKSVGGLWNYSPDPGTGVAYRSLHLNTSREATSFTGYPMPASYPRYPRHEQVAAYLSAFTDHYGLGKSLELDTEVVAVTKDHDEGWQVTTRSGKSGEKQQRRFANVIVATGQHWLPALPDPAIADAESFTGAQLHSAAYREPSVYADKRVLIVGIGNSGCDIAVELSRVARSTVLSLRRGVHIVPKQMLGIPISDIAARRWWARMPFRLQRRFVEVLLRIIRGDITDYGIPEPDHRIFSAPITISDELLSRISHGDVTIRPKVTRFNGATAEFADGTQSEIDAVIYCTGYQIDIPFLPREYIFSQDNRITLYQRVVAPNWPGLYAVGFIRPIGAITRLLEAQAGWVAELIDGTATLPSTTVMTDEITKYLTSMATRYSTNVSDSIHVDVAAYLAAISRERSTGDQRGQQQNLTAIGDSH